MDKEHDLILSMEPKQEEIGIVIDLAKATRGKLNTSKLVKKPVQVKGKDGKTFTRMQWMKTHEEEPVEKPKAQEEVPSTKNAKVKDEGTKVDMNASEDTGENLYLNETNIEAKLKLDLKTQEGFLLNEYNNFSKEERWGLIENYKIPHPTFENKKIHNMRAMEALKAYMAEHPDKFGAGHLPSGSKYEKNPEGDDLINAFYDKVKGDVETLYTIMKENGIGDGKDPRIDLGIKGRPIHMRNVTAFKEVIEKKMTILEDPRWKVKQKKRKKTKQKSKAERLGNNIESVMDGLSEEEKFGYIKLLEISDEDYTTADKVTRAAMLKHLKIKIILDPSILNKDPLTGAEAKEEIERKENQTEDEGLKEKVNDFFGTLLIPTKEMLIDEYSDIPEMANRTRYDDKGIDYMRGLETLKKHFMKNPELLQTHDFDYEEDLLAQFKMTNKQAEQVFRHVGGYKGSVDAKRIERDKSGRTIEWDLDESTMRIDRDEYGNWVLYINHLDFETDEYTEKVFDLKDISDFTNKLDGRGLPKEKVIPLHDKSLEAIQTALNKDLSNLTPKVSDKISKFIYDRWVETGKQTAISAITEGQIITTDTVDKILSQMGITTDMTYIKKYNKAWEENMYKHLIQPTKTKNAVDYFVTDDMDTRSVYVLHESAKQWTPEERDIARKELIEDMSSVPRDEDGKNRGERYREHLKQATSYLPFDIFSEICARETKIQLKGTTIHHKKDEDGNWVEYEVEFLGAHFTPKDNAIYVSQRYFYGDSVFSDTALGNDPGVTESGHIMNTLGMVIAHEMAHCVDNLFSEGNATGSPLLDWTGNTGKKYVGAKYARTNPVATSYNQIVESSNPGKKMGIVRDEDGGVAFLYHKGNWIDSYEGRVYGKPYNNLDPSVVERTENGLVDKEYLKGIDRIRGVEHWSHSVARFATARMAYKDAEYPGTFEEWCAETSSREDVGSVNDSYDAEQDIKLSSHGKEYMNMRNNNKHISKAISDIFDRGDFKGLKAPSYTEQLNESHYHDKTIVRKSDDVSLYVGGAI